MRVVILGGSGLLGGWLVNQHAKDSVLATRHQTHRPGLVKLNLADTRAIHGLVERHRPHLVYLIGAITSPAACQNDPKLAVLVNTKPASILVELARRFSFRLIHASTDLVFDGSTGSYAETDPVAPLSIYGQTKVQAERIIVESQADALTVRLPLIVGSGPYGPLGTLGWMADCLKQGQKVPLFTDEIRSPQSVQILAKGLAGLAEQATPGIWHLAGPISLSRYELGRQICQALDWPSDDLVPVLQKTLKLLPSRPSDVSLKVDKVNNLLGNEAVPPLSETIKYCLDGPVD